MLTIKGFYTNYVITILNALLIVQLILQILTKTFHMQKGNPIKY